MTATNEQIRDEAKRRRRAHSRANNWTTPSATMEDFIIDAARLEGIRLGLEAAEKKVWSANWNAALRVDENADAIRALDPETIAREAVLDTLTSEAQEQNMGYDND